MGLIKKLDIYVLKNFIPMLLGTFVISLFVVMMQFLWKYVDELIGKGLTMDILAQFFYYAALTLIPTSLPLAILLAALISFGNLGESFELLAIKAAGISLMKVLRPLILIVTILGVTSFYFQNVIAPISWNKLYTLLWSMRQTSPELDIPEGAFYNEIQGYNVYVKKKDKETGLLTKKIQLPIAGEYPKDAALFPDNKHLVSLNHENNTMTFFAVDMKAGTIVMNAN